MASTDPIARSDEGPVRTFDVIVVGAGLAGLHMLYRMRELGLSVCVLEAAGDVGGTWYWNRYPGARCDVESMDYSYAFSPELEQDWTWTERYASQAEILRYINHVADRFDLRRDIQLYTRVTSAHYDERAARWMVGTEQEERFSSQFCVFATGTLSAPIAPPFPGVDRFAGEWYLTQQWPHNRVELAGKRVGIIGTGSSGVQAIPMIAEDAAHLTVFQRTPNFSVPAHNRPLTATEVAERKATYRTYRSRQRWSRAGVPLEVNPRRAHEMTPSEQRAELERRWARGGALGFLAAFRDTLLNIEANETVQEFVRMKIREIVDDPQVADLLCPSDHAFGAKRPCVDHGYYATFNRENVTLVDVGNNPISEITPAGIKLADGTEHPVDIIVYAMGYDALSGALLRIDIRGRDGLTLADEWANGPASYLGLCVARFPNLFTITGPGSPAVLAQMIMAIEQHVNWITDCIAHLRAHDISEIEADRNAQRDWTRHVHEIAHKTMYTHARNSYYQGANVPGKPRVFAIYTGGLDRYRSECDDVTTNGYRGFTLTPSALAHAAPGTKHGCGTLR